MHWELFVLAAELFSQPKTANRTEVSLHVNTEHLLKFFSEMAGYQVKRLFKHRTAFDGVDGIAFFQSPVQFLDQRAFSRTDRPHQVKNLPAFFSLERRRVKIAHDLGDGF